MTEYVFGGSIRQKVLYWLPQHDATINLANENVVLKLGDHSSLKNVSQMMAEKEASFRNAWLES